MPLVPLELRILAADLSAEAQELHAAMFARLVPELGRVGMQCAVKYRTWDVTDALSTAGLMDAWLEHAGDAEVYLVFVSAFSRFAGKGNNGEAVLQAFRDITLRVHDRIFLVAWIEPAMNESKKFLPRLIERLLGAFKGRGKASPEGLEGVFKYRHPLNSEVIPGRAKVVSFQKVQS